MLTVPAPAGRELFFEEQRRHRRASRRFSVLAVVAVLLSGLPLCVLLSPLLFALSIIVARVFHVVLPSPWALPWAVRASMLVAPGAVLMLGAWLWTRRLFAHVGAGGTVRRFGARPLRRGVVEELQIINIVEELAVAAGVPPPRAMLIDSPAANVVAIGRTLDDATILVSRGLLDLDRDARQAILAHVIGSVGNGDLKIASIILSVFQTWGLLALLLDAPFGPRSRRALRFFATVSRDAWRSEADRQTASVMLDRLMDGASLKFDDLDEHTSMAGRSGPLWREAFVHVPLYLTMGVGSIAAKASIALFTLLVFGPWVSMLWRARRRLADATAVQLTRNPDALARAVREMENRDVVIERGEPVSFLFPFWKRWTPGDPARDDVTAYVVAMHLEHDKRLSPQGPDWLVFVGWCSLAFALVMGCIAFSTVATTLFTWGAWWLLQMVHL